MLARPKVGIPDEVARRGTAWHRLTEVRGKAGTMLSDSMIMMLSFIQVRGSVETDSDGPETEKNR